MIAIMVMIKKVMMAMALGSLMRLYAEENAKTFTVLPAGNTPALAHPGTNAIPYWIHPASWSFWLMGEYSSALGHA